MSNIKDIIYKEINNRFEDKSNLIQELISPAVGIKLKHKNVTDLHEETPLFQSKIGGFPDIQENFIWPNVNNNPLTFLCQIDLEKVAHLHPELELNGILYFFIANSGAIDISKLQSSFCIIHKENRHIKHTKLKEGPVGLEEYFIDFCEHYTLPSYQERIIDENHYYNSVSDDIMQLSDYISELTCQNEDFIRHHIFGDPNAVQGSVRIFWGAGILKPEDPFYERMPEYFHSAQEIGDNFILLLQLDLTDEYIKLDHYGDNCLYFGILKEDLKHKNFANAKLVIQCT